MDSNATANRSTPPSCCESEVDGQLVTPPGGPSQLPSAAFSEPVCAGGAVLRNWRRDPQPHRPIRRQLDASDRVSGSVSTADQGSHSTAPPQCAQISHGVLMCMFPASIRRSRILSRACERGWAARPTGHFPPHRADPACARTSSRVQFAPTRLIPPRCRSWNRIGGAAIASKKSRGRAGNSPR
jgi:hypothetical protein